MCMYHSLYCDVFQLALCWTLYSSVPVRLCITCFVPRCTPYYVHCQYMCLYIAVLAACEKSLLDDLPDSSFVGDSTHIDHPASDVVIDWAYDAPDSFWESTGVTGYSLPRIWVRDLWWLIRLQYKKLFVIYMYCTCIFVSVTYSHYVLYKNMQYASNDVRVLCLFLFLQGRSVGHLSHHASSQSQSIHGQ